MTYFPSCGRLAVALTIPLAAASLAACSDRPSTIEPRPRFSVARYVTADVQHAIDANGLFVDQHTPLSPLYEEITGQRAVSIATAFLGDFAPWVQSALEIDRGGQIDLAHLRPCGRAFYAASAYETPPPDATIALRKSTGPYWLVPFCAAGTEEVLVGISAYATEVTIDGRGRIANFGNGNFSVQGVPLGLQLPIPPEDVARDIASVSHQTIASVPELIMRERPRGPGLALWHIRTGSPIGVRNSRGRRTTEDVFVGYYAHWAQEVATADTVPGSSRERTALDLENDPGLGSPVRNARANRPVLLRLRMVVPAQLVRVDLEVQ